MIEQRLTPGDWPRHRHRTAYAAVVLSGGYFEAGGEGRFRVEAGDVVVHAAFDAHLNRLARHAWVLNLPLEASLDLPPVFQVGDLPALERACREDAGAAVALLRPVSVRPPLAEDWPDLLAARLRDGGRFNLGVWAGERGLRPATVSRGFGAAFGVSPSRYRAEHRARRAVHRLATCAQPMAELALDCGYADQAHMSREVRALTGAPPRVWRGKSLQDGTPAER